MNGEQLTKNLQPEEAAIVPGVARGEAGIGRMDEVPPRLRTPDFMKKAQARRPPGMTPRRPS